MARKHSLLPVINCSARPGSIESRSGVLVNGLQQLKVDGATRFFGKEKDPFYHAISPVSKRANECVEQADAEFFRFETRKSMRPKRRNSIYEDGRSSIDTIAGATAAFESLVSEIEETLQKGGADSVHVVKRGDSVSERVPPRGVRRYKVPLPERPKEIVVSLTRTQGSVPAMWASTSDAHPDANTHEFAGKDEKIVYKHALPPPTAGDIDISIDRRRVAPSCRELFVTVEATGECHYDLSVAFNNVTIVLSRKELGAHIAKLKRSWVTRVNELQREPEAREEFEDHITELRKAAVKKKNDVGGGCSFVQQNMFLVQERTPRHKAFELHKKALRNVAHQEAVSARRAEQQLVSARRPERTCIGHENETSKRLKQFGTTLCHSPLEAIETPAITFE